LDQSVGTALTTASAIRSTPPCDFSSVFSPRTGGVARHDTGCTVVAVGAGDHFDPNPDALEPLPAESELVLVGDAEAETRFIERFGRAAPAG
jgi:K+/H+ antiporter YhaU regulatory subunit KhtT